MELKRWRRSPREFGGPSFQDLSNFESTLMDEDEMVRKDYEDDEMMVLVPSIVSLSDSTATQSI